MSELAALKPKGKYYSAFSYRDHYLHGGEAYDEFFCPFCYVPLTPVLIYELADKEMGKSPHFRTKRKGKKHGSGCDGYPLKLQNATGGKQVKTRVRKRQFKLPTKFIEKVVRLSTPFKNRTAPSSSANEIRRRREAASQISNSNARYAVSLVQSMAEPHMIIVAKSYKLAKEKNWSSKEQQKWIHKQLDEPLNLRGSKLIKKFGEAFHGLWKWLPVVDHSLIYHGEKATVRRIESGYEITSERKGKITDNKFLPFVVTVTTDDIDKKQVRRAYTAMLRDLGRAQAKNAKIKWYAYGSAKLVNERFEMHFDNTNIGDLFVRFWDPASNN